MGQTGTHVQTKQRGRLSYPADWELVESQGPFDTRLVYRLPDGSYYVWDQRRHRKGLGPREPSGQAAEQADRAPQAGQGGLWVWAPGRISWWVAIAFVVGSALFAVGGVASLFPRWFGGQETAGLVTGLCNWTGALFFTVSLYLWLLEGINSSDSIGMLSRHRSRQRFSWFAWQPRRLEFVAPFLFLVGSLLFNVETSLVVAEEVGWLKPPTAVTVLSFAGSVLFLVPSYLQLVEVSHGFVSWRPRALSWWVVVLFILGSVGFVAGAVVGFPVPAIPPAKTLETLGLLLGAVFFLVGSYLMVPELATE